MWDPNTDTADYQIQSTETSIVVKTETQGYSQSFTLTPEQAVGARDTWEEKLFACGSDYRTVDLSSTTAGNIRYPSTIAYSSTSQYPTGFQYSVRGEYRGQVYLATAGAWTFKGTADDGVRISVDQVEIANKW